MKRRQLAFLCLGVMGAPMAGHLARAGHVVHVYNRTRSRAEVWGEAYREHEIKIAATPAEAAREAEVVFACTGADPDLREIALGQEGAFGAMPQGSVFVDHTTASASIARELSREAAERGLGFLDAPVSGGQAGAEQGQLTIMLGGEEAVYDRVSPLLDHYAKKHLLLGPAGHGQLAKMVNQICIAGLLEALSEGLLFGERVGLDVKKVVEVIAEGAAGSWQMKNRAETMIDGDFDFGFAVDWMRKDLSMALAEADRIGSPVPVTRTVDQRYAEIQRMGGGRFDTSSLILGLRSEKND
ncbi:MAG: NAD(P)-dependent oxidoreductase [Myxococcota bacterium]